MVVTGYAAAATDNRNLLAITGGTNFVTGIYEIVAVTPGASGVGSWTLDRNCTTGVGAGMTGNMGGARLGFTGGTNTLVSSYVSGNKIWVKNEAWNEAFTCATGGSGSAPCVVEGYNTARGDAPTTTAAQPKNNRASAAGDAITTSALEFIWKYIQVTGAGGSGFVSSAGRETYWFCRSFSNGARGFHCGTSDGQTYLGCESYSNTSNGMGTSISPFCFGCSIHDNSSGGISTNGNNFTGHYNIIFANAGSGLACDSGSLWFISNTVYGNTGASSDGVNCNPSHVSTLFLNNILANNGRDGVRSGSTYNGIVADYNDYNGNSGVARTNFPTGPNDSTLAPTFTNAGAGDFSIGTNLKALGWPGVFPGATSTGYLDIGAVQRVEGGGSSASMLVHPGMAGGCRG